MSIEIKRQTERQRTRESGPTRKSPIPACGGTLGRRSELAGCICVCFSPLTPALPAPLRTKPPFPPVRPILTRTKTLVDRSCNIAGRNIVNLGRSLVSQLFSLLLRVHIFLEPSYQ